MIPPFERCKVGRTLSKLGFKKRLFYHCEKGNGWQKAETKYRVILDFPTGVLTKNLL